MTIWQIILIICGIITAIVFILTFLALLIDDKKFKEREWWMLPATLIIIPIVIIGEMMTLQEYLSEVWKDGGFRKHYQLKRERKAEYEAEQVRLKAERAEYERIKKAYLSGKLTRDELPRAEDGIETFEFETEMGLYVDKWSSVQEIVYVENEYNEVLNSFFQRHQDLRLYHMYKFVYLPCYSKELETGDTLRYLHPDLPEDFQADVKMDSSYPIPYLWYSDDAAKIKHGMMFFMGDKENRGAKYILGHYYPLEEGSDEDIIAQLDAIVKKVYNDHGEGGLYCKAEKPDIKEGTTDDYADELFTWILHDDEVAVIVKEIRDRIKILSEKGLTENLLKKLLNKETRLSRLMVTKDMRIVLPDYNNMEIKMEPINKAVFLLFLRHPEGIIFKHLPDYRKELADIYQKIKPLGLNEKAIQSIEDVTNPCLNSINEKCARIRGAFISKFDEELAQHYYIYGRRGEPKKISLPRDLVIWE